MNISILSYPSDLSAYVAEILKTWGLPLYDFIGSEAVSSLACEKVPIIICPAQKDVAIPTKELNDYAYGGGVVIYMLPDAKMIDSLGVVYHGKKGSPGRLRVTQYPVGGLAGELLPVVGQIGRYQAGTSVQTLAYLSHPGGYHDETPGILELQHGQGRILIFAFDLPLCILMLRQGDSSRAEMIPEGDGCARPSHMASDIGPNDTAWIPYADILARLFIDQIKRLLKMPIPVLSHLPGSSAGILLYSGDEDSAPVAANEEEFQAVTAAGGRMNLYIIPENTDSNASDIARYQSHHDIGPHPNLRPLDRKPVVERVAEFERQIRLFMEMYGIHPRSLRNHCTAWAGYLELVEVMESLHIRMEGNYFSGTYMRDREGGPYAGFGAAIPMRFCTPEGRILDVVQQHTHLSDDVLFGEADYSYRFSPEQYEIILNRILTDMTTRFHTPYAVCIHPGNWVRFSRDQGLALLERANAFQVPIWSFDQWSVFWDARDTWRHHELTWEKNTLRCVMEGATHEELSLALPVYHEGCTLQTVHLNENKIEGKTVLRFGEPVSLVPLTTSGGHVVLTARYDTMEAPK